MRKWCHLTCAALSAFLGFTLVACGVAEKNPSAPQARIGVTPDSTRGDTTYHSAAIRTAVGPDGPFAAKTVVLAVFNGQWHERYRPKGVDKGWWSLRNRLQLFAAIEDTATAVALIGEIGGTVVLSALQPLSWGDLWTYHVVLGPSEGSLAVSTIPLIDYLRAYAEHSEVFVGVQPIREWVDAERMPAYTGYNSFFVWLAPGYSVADLRQCDEESGLPLSEATYDERPDGLIVVKFDRVFDDPEATAETLQALAAVARAQPVGLSYAQ